VTDLTEITAISPLDGRYASKASVLRPYCSEHGLIHRRVIVELRWFQALCAEPAIAELPPLTEAAQHHIEGLIRNFSPAESSRVKAIEAGTNHDGMFRPVAGTGCLFWISALRLHLGRHQQSGLWAYVAGPVP
jgi:hypothetical protein